MVFRWSLMLISGSCFSNVSLMSSLLYYYDEQQKSTLGLEAR